MMRSRPTVPRRRATGGLHPSSSSRRLVAGAGAVALAGTLAACDASASADDAGDFFDTSAVHTVSVEYDEDDYQEMLDTFADTGDKDWISASVTIDGDEYDDVGLRLKGNSSLRGLGGDAVAPQASADDDAAAHDGAANDEGQQQPGADEGDGNASADDPAGLPWLIRLDKDVDGQEHDGRADFVVRGNNTESSLNEAVALKVLELADVTAEQATYTRFSVNGGDEQLRLVIDLPDDDLWNEDAYPDGGITYKADADGDWAVKDDAAAYAESFEAKYDSAGSTDDDAAYEPLQAFLEFVNNSSDADFAAKLGDHLDVDSFARYLAAQDLVANSDDIDGPGNNAYLHDDPESGLMEVVAWDQNLSYGGFGTMGGGPGLQGGARPSGAPEGMELPEGMTRPDGAQGGGPGGGGGVGGQENPLVTRFLENDDFNAAYESAVEDLTASIYGTGDAQDYLDTLTATLADQASDLVDADTLKSESQSVSDLLAVDAVQAGQGQGGLGTAGGASKEDSDDAATDGTTSGAGA
ncbi:CotH kinase family protein [Krasilnikoviella flava]|uniref:Spore coat protein CotH n=1 Tax=Krasilnikoviella flava TaxID=526729 RepID=A0A1T5K992_9MICO|nr:CotH kinase family protein [Krasilnikoviella flava]SKC59998.1 Spore coat protein CotH [Krasilnikoviella flava]